MFLSLNQKSFPMSTRRRVINTEYSVLQTSHEAAGPVVQYCNLRSICKTYLLFIFFKGQRLIFSSGEHKKMQKNEEKKMRFNFSFLLI